MKVSICIKAQIFAEEKHRGQLDDEGKSYFDAHIIPVYDAVSRLTDDLEIRAAAILHDTVEDTNTTYGELIIEFGKRVADLVMEVTHEGEKDSYGYYFPRLKSKEGFMIKLVDRASNISRMNKWSGDRQNHYMKKTVFWKDGSDREFYPESSSQITGRSS